jgi:hypothetical protein
VQLRWAPWHKKPSASRCQGCGCMQWSAATETHNDPKCGMVMGEGQMVGWGATHHKSCRHDLRFVPKPREEFVRILPGQAECFTSANPIRAITSRSTAASPGLVDSPNTFESTPTKQRGSV